MAVRNISVLVLYNEQHQILLQHRSEDAVRLPNYWAFFGGGIKQHETPEQTVTREILEELEYPVINPQLVFTQKFLSKGDENTKYVFVEKYNDTHPLVQHEGQGMRWLGFEDLKDLLIVDHDRIALLEVKKFLELQTH